MNITSYFVNKRGTRFWHTDNYILISTGWDFGSRCPNLSFRHGEVQHKVFDNVLAAAVASMLMGKLRRKRHFRAIKVYTMMCDSVKDQSWAWGISMYFPHHLERPGMMWAWERWWFHWDFCGHGSPHITSSTDSRGWIIRRRSFSKKVMVARTRQRSDCIKIICVIFFRDLVCLYVSIHFLGMWCVCWHLLRESSIEFHSSVNT